MLLGRHHGWLFGLGDKLLCRLENIAPVSGDISLSWISGGSQQAETARSFRKIKDGPKDDTNQLDGADAKLSVIPHVKRFLLETT